MDGDALASLATHVPHARLVQCCGIEWLKHQFGLYRRHPETRGPREPSAPLTGLDHISFVYVDPPYPMETRTKPNIYRHEFTPEQHQHLLDVVRRLPVPCMVSSYPNAIYDAALSGWRSFDFQATTRGGLRTERVWCNYPEPERLHDSRFVGDDKRQRERVRRRVRNWVSGLKKAAPGEQQAMLDAIAEEFNLEPKR